MAIPITLGSGAASIASEKVGTSDYQQIKVIDGTASSTNTWTIDSAGSAKVATGASSVIVLSIGSVITVPQSSSIIAITSGSIVTLSSGSIISVPIGSTIAVLQSPSIVGTYAEDAAHTSGEKGIFSLGVRNDSQSSITNADGDYSPLAVGPTGAMIATDSPITKWVQGTADLRVSSGGSIVAIVAQGASIFTYVREVQIANMGPASVLVTITGGLGSVLGYTIAPAGGGSNFITRYKTGENSAVAASISGIASVLVSIQGFTAKI